MAVRPLPRFRRRLALSELCCFSFVFRRDRNEPVGGFAMVVDFAGDATAAAGVLQKCRSFDIHEKATT
jgi:hypothetical protein